MARPQAWGPKRRGWRKIHLGIDEQTLEVRAVEITGNPIGDAPVLPDLLSQIPADEQIGSVTADGAYDTRKCHDALADRGAHAVIPPGLRQFRAELIHRINSRPPFTPAGTPDHGRLQTPARSYETSTARIEIPRPGHLASPLGSILRMRLPGSEWSGYHRRSRVGTKPAGIMLRMTLPVSGCIA